MNDIQTYLTTYFKGTKNPSLNVIKYLIKEFNHPEKDLKVVHIAGTNGKGSCVETMTNILIKAGYKVEKFLSPHLIKYNERISINNKNISDNEMEKLIKRIKPKIDNYNELSETRVSLFELETIMALLYFKENKCDIAVFETGLGGKLDSTNVVNPIVSIITSIGYDHMHILGNTLEKIAEQKAGIIKENSSTVFISQEKEVDKVIENKCKIKNNDLHLILKEDISNYSYNAEYQKFDYKNYKDIQINLKGEKQLNNASLCIECCEILNSKGIRITEDAMREGLKTVIHRGRFEIINKKPLVIFDGAHNEAAIKNFVNSVNMYYNKNKKVYVVSLLKVKDYKAILKILLKDNESIFIFTDGNDKNKYIPKEKLLEYSKKISSKLKVYAEDLEDVIHHLKDDYVTFFVGSFYIYGDVVKK